MSGDDGVTLNPMKALATGESAPPTASDAEGDVDSSSSSKVAEGAATVDPELALASFSEPQAAALRSIIPALASTACRREMDEMVYAHPTSSFRSCNWHQANVHFLMVETDPEKRSVRACFCAGAALMVLLQLSTTAALFFGAIQAPCASNDQCPDGQFCMTPAPELLLERGRDPDDTYPNRCMDCKYGHNCKGPHSTKGPLCVLTGWEEGSEYEGGQLAESSPLTDAEVRDSFGHLQSLPCGLNEVCDFNNTAVMESCRDPIEDPYDAALLYQVGVTPGPRVLDAKAYAQAANWCERCVRNHHVAHVSHGKAPAIHMWDGAIAQANNINAMAFYDWLTFLLTSTLVAANLARELADIKLCELALAAHCESDGETSGWLTSCKAAPCSARPLCIFGLTILNAMRRYCFLPAMAMTPPLLVMMDGGDTKRICFNTVAILFLAEVRAPQTAILRHSNALHLRLTRPARIPACTLSYCLLYQTRLRIGRWITWCTSTAFRQALSTTWSGTRSSSSARLRLTPCRSARSSTSLSWCRSSSAWLSSESPRRSRGHSCL